MSLTLGESTRLQPHMLCGASAPDRVRKNAPVTADHYFSAEPTTPEERREVAFTVAGRGTIAPGDYTFQEVSTAYTLGPRRKVAGTIRVGHGGY